MKRFLSIVGLFFLTGMLYAQVEELTSDTIKNESLPVIHQSIVDKITRNEPGKGKVRIIQDNLVNNRIGRPRKTTAAQNNEYVEMNGWRVQVFAGNNQRLSKEEAFKKETDIKLTFPELSTYVRYSAPFWRLRVGDCRTYKDASDILQKLRREFPAFGREMSIVKETILVKK